MKHNRKIVFIIALFLTVCFQIFGQNIGLSFKEAKEQGIVMKHLDSLYVSAIHSDTAKAVFKTETEHESLQQQYYKLLKDLGNFLSQNNFDWEKPTRCYNRIYFNADGSIDYFLFNFVGKPENKPIEEKQIEFKRLLNLFIKDYKFDLTAKTKFSQCSPTTYMPKQHLSIDSK